MIRRAVGDLPGEFRPWDVPSHRRLGRPLLKGAMPLAAVVDAASRTGTRRENAYRVVRRLRQAGVLKPPEHIQGPIKLAPGQAKRLRAALAAAASSEQQYDTTGEGIAASERREGEGTDSRAGRLQHGDVLIGVTVAPDLVASFASVLERVAEANPSLWGTVMHGQRADYLFVADDRDADVLAITRQFEAAGVQCCRAQASVPMDSDSLVAHSRRLRNAEVLGSRGLDP